MKTKKMRLIAWMITLAAVMTGVNAEAQRRETGSQRNSSQKQSKQYSERRNDNRSYKKSDRNRGRQSTSRDYRNSDRSRYNNHDQERGDKRTYEYKRNDRAKISHHSPDLYTRQYGNKYYKYDRRYEYRHPKYGRVYKRFYADPIRIRHQHFGDYYFYGGNYYRYHRGIGYVLVELPQHLVFEHLPFHCDQFWVGPHLYFRYGDLVFERCDHGFRIAPSLDIRLSAHF